MSNANSGSLLHCPGLQYLPCLRGTQEDMYRQAGAGLVAESVPQLEFEETTNKAAALGRAIDLAEQAFLE